VSSVLLVGLPVALRDEATAALAGRGVAVGAVDGQDGDGSAHGGVLADVVVVDATAPGNQGLRWLRRLRAGGPWAEAVLLLPAPTSEAQIEELCLELAVAVVIQPPFTGPLLVGRVAPLLGGGLEAAAPSAPASAEDLAPSLEQLRGDFAARLPAKLAAVAEALEAVRAAPENAALIETATRLAHRLHGTAGAYGFPDVGEAAGRFEDALCLLQPAATLEERATLLSAAAAAV